MAEKKTSIIFSLNFVVLLYIRCVILCMLFCTISSHFQSTKNEKQLRRKSEGQKKSRTILNEILQTNKRTIIDDEVYF